MTTVERTIVTLRNEIATLLETAYQIEHELEREHERMEVEGKNDELIRMRARRRQLEDVFELLVDAEMAVKEA